MRAPIIESGFAEISLAIAIGLELHHASRSAGAATKIVDGNRGDAARDTRPATEA